MEAYDGQEVQTEQPQQAQPEQAAPQEAPGRARGPDGRFAAAESNEPPAWLDEFQQNFADQLSQLGDRVEEQGNVLQDALSRDPEYEYDDPFPQYDQGQDPNQIRQAVNEAVQEALTPLHRAENERQWDAFFNDHPDMEDEQNAAPVAQAIQEIAAQAANGDERAADALLDDPRFVRTVYESITGGQQSDEGEGEWAEDPADNVFQKMWADQQEAPVNELQRNLVQDEVERQVRERLGPIEEDHRTEGFKALAERYPDILSDEMREALVPAVHAAARRLDPEGKRGLHEDPEFVHMVYLAKKGEERAAGETPVGAGREVSLEDGGGTPGEPEPDHLMQRLWAQKQQRTLRWD